MTDEELAEEEAAMMLRVARLASRGMSLDALNHARTQALIKLLLGPERDTEARAALVVATDEVVSEIEAMTERSALLRPATANHRPPTGPAPA